MTPSGSLVEHAVIRLGQASGNPVGGTVVATAPGRVNLIGEHTDYSGGLVLPIAIDRRTAVAVRGASDAAWSRIVSEGMGDAARLDLRASLRAPMLVEGRVVEGSHGIRFGSWTSYVAGVLAQFQRHHGLRENLDLAIVSDVPLGSGLSSSAALESACVLAVERWMGLALSPVERARMGRRSEHEFAGVPCGIMDQFASVMGVAGRALLIDCRSERVEPVAMPSENVLRVVVMNTNVRHALADGAYAARRAACERAARGLGVAMLRDATRATIDRAASELDEDALRASRHVVSENERVLEAFEALRHGQWATLGRLMLDSHASLRDVYRVSCPELDTLVEGALRVPGVWGARMTGGGFGGCAIAIAEPSAVERLALQVGGLYHQRHGREATFIEVRADAGARVETQTNHKDTKAKK